MGDDVGRSLPCLLHETAHDVFLVVAKRPALPRHRERATGAAGVARETERQRQRPDAVALDLRCVLACERPLNRRIQRGRHTVRGRDLDHSRLLQPAQLQATGVRVERLDGAAKHDVRERLEIELGGERLAQAPHCRLQARALACDEVQAALCLGDALGALA